MHGLMLLISAAAAAPANAALPPQLPPAVQADLQCFVLFAAAVGTADKKDEKTQLGGTVGMMYFFGKLKGEAPNVDLQKAFNQELDAFDARPNKESIANACDREFEQRGKELDALAS